MKTSEKFHILSTIMFVIFVTLICKATHQKYFNYTEVSFLVLSVTVGIASNCCSSVMLVREALINSLPGIAREVDLIKASADYDIQVLYILNLPRIPWYLGGDLYRNGDIVTIATCAFSHGSKDAPSVNIVHLARTEKDTLQMVCRPPENRTYLQAPSA